jgi:hypothetical protein
MLHDRQALAHLFKPGAMLIVSGGLAEARDPRRVFQARDTALVLAGRAIDVVRRTGNGSWRYAISLLELDKATQQR